jgi:hypothetical protein
MNMPHLAELQVVFRERDVRIISISDDPLELVEALLERKADEHGKSYGEITSEYSLTTDPDGSSYRDYMDAAGQVAIPKAFLVGKTGLIEWIGHPMELDQPLNEVLDDVWDREQFKRTYAQQSQLQEAMRTVTELIADDRLNEAISFCQQQLSVDQPSTTREQWAVILQSLLFSSEQSDPEVISFYRGELEQFEGDPAAVIRFSASICDSLRDGRNVGSLSSDAIVALEHEIDQADEKWQPLLYTSLARLHETSGDLDKAIQSMQKAVNVSKSGGRDRMQRYLDEIQQVPTDSPDAVPSTPSKDK